jgi:hypothetical protein
MAIAQASDFGNRTADTHECGRLYWSAECVCGFHGSARTRAALIALILDHEGWRLRQRREPGFVAVPVGKTGIAIRRRDENHYDDTDL